MKTIRYAVVGLGHIAQTAVLPAFVNARKNSRLTALISDDPTKLRRLSREYQVEHTFSYADYEVALRSGTFDAVYIALPNHLHHRFAVHAAHAGIHVLCEKPFALDEVEAMDIIKACAENNAKLMVAYRLHFQRGNLEAIRALQSGSIGEPRIFNSLFTMQVQPGNIRLDKRKGGGTLYDIGIYCINAARYLFRDEPEEVFAYSSRNQDERFQEVDEMTSVLMRFPNDRLASFTASFGAADTANYEVIGTRGIVSAKNAYEYSASMQMTITVDGRSVKRKYPRSDQFGPELVYFSDCIRKNTEPEPSGIEGLLDVHIIRALYESARIGAPVRIKELRKQHRPTRKQAIHRRAVPKPLRVHVTEPTR